MQEPVREASSGCSSMAAKVAWKGFAALTAASVLLITLVTRSAPLLASLDLAFASVADLLASVSHVVPDVLPELLPDLLPNVLPDVLPELLPDLLPGGVTPFAPDGRSASCLPNLTCTLDKLADVSKSIPSMVALARDSFAVAVSTSMPNPAIRLHTSLLTGTAVDTLQLAELVAHLPPFPVLNDKGKLGARHVQ